MKYDDGKVHTLYITNITLFGVFLGARQRAKVFDSEDVAQKIIMQSRSSDRESYTVIPLSDIRE